MIKSGPWCVVPAAFASLIVSTAPCWAGQLIYTPVNPSFGGNPLNGSYVLGLAAANNSKFTQNPASKSASQPNSARQFQEEITSSLLSQIASTIGQQILGKNASDSGTFNISGTIVDFKRAGGQININVRDGATGGTTAIQIPVPQY